MHYPTKQDVLILVLCLLIIGLGIWAYPLLCLELAWGLTLGLFFAYMMGFGIRSLQVVIVAWFLLIPIMNHLGYY